MEPLARKRRGVHIFQLSWVKAKKDFDFLTQKSLFMLAKKSHFLGLKCFMIFFFGPNAAWRG